jgi:sigma-B regulation protein RsbU (phosphoserine phosphatase)
MSTFRKNFREFWKWLSRFDLVAMAVSAVGAMAFLLGGSGNALSFAKFLGTLAALYVLFRVMGFWRARLLWSLRNRLIVAYLFVALVPVFLLLTLALLSTSILYTQLGGFLLYQDVQLRVQMLSDGADQIAAALGSVTPNVPPEVAERIVAAQEHAVYDKSLPGLVIEFADDPRLLTKVSTPPHKHFAGLIQQGNKLTAYGLHAVQTPQGMRVVTLKVPLNEDFIATLGTDLGPVEFDLLDPVEGPQTAVTYTLGGKDYKAAKRFAGTKRTLQAARGWWDAGASGLSKFEAVLVQEDGKVEMGRPVIAFFQARPSRLNDRMFASVGELGRLYIFGFAVTSTLFLLLEIAALITGVVMTRRITTAVDDLYQATQFVQAGDLSHRVRVEHRDQLGILGESFNQMTGSIGNLIQEQTKRQRLENEISIAQEVQNQLFPQVLPSVPGVEIQAICKAARSVSGDYYDFIQLSATHLAIAIADISGKGISAALLMASLQAALRSQMLAPGSEMLSTAELVARLNTHLVRNTADDRFATFFIAVYDSATRMLRYTNAGHLPSFLISQGKSVHLDKGGMVLGIIEDYVYEEGSLQVPPGALLVGYSDGLVEPENVYGEEFGIRRLEDAAARVKNAGPHMVAESLMAAAEEWAGTPEQADDMTVVVALLR